MTARSSDIDSTISEIHSLIAQSPTDVRLRLQLFEVLHANNRVDEFVLEALDYKASCGLSLGEIWVQICRMGREIDPENPIFVEARKTKMKPARSGLPVAPQSSTGTYVREQQIDPVKYYPKGYHPDLLEDWPVAGDLVVPVEQLPENLKRSMGEAWRLRTKNREALEQQKGSEQICL